MMKLSERMRLRREHGRRVTPVQVYLPEDILGDLEEMAEALGQSSSELLLRSWIGQGFRQTRERLAGETEPTSLKSAGERSA